MRNFSELTVDENVILHLGDYSRFMDHFVVPFSTTQAGIAEVTSIARSHVARAIKNLKKKNMVFEKKARVEKSDRKRKVYFLTSEGTMKLKSLRQIITYQAAMSSNIPLTSNFIGRKNELEKLSAWANSKSKILVVQGVLGIGKTSLVSRFVTESIEHKIVFWHSVKRSDTVKDILNTLGDILYMKNNNILRYLLSDFEINDKKILMNLANNLSSTILVFDDCKNMNEDVTDFISKMVSTIDKMKHVRMIFITEDEMQFLSGLFIHKTVSKLKLTGLEKNETRQLLKGKSFSDGIYGLTNGHPLFLKLIDPDCELRGDVQDYLKKYIKTNLSKEEKKIMEVASVHRLPFKAKALFIEAGADYEAMTRLINKSLLTEISNDLYVVHEFFKEHFYRLLTKTRKKTLHRKAANYYLECGDGASIVEAIHHYVASQEFEKAADIVISSGVSLIEKGRFTELDRALRTIEEEIIEKSKLAEILVLKGHLQKVRGNWEKALNKYRLALKIYEKQKMVEKIADAHRLIGAIYKDKGDYSKALEEFDYALSLLRKDENEVAAKIYDDIGTLCLRRRELDEAEKTIRLGLKIANKIGKENQIANNTLTLGNLYLGREDWDKAKQTYNRSLDIYERNQNLRMLAVCYNNLGITYFKTGDVKKAIDYWKKGISISEKIGDIKVMLSYANLGFMTFKKGDWIQAEEYCRKALGISENIGNAMVSSSAYSILGHINLNRRNFSECIKYYKKALKLREKEGDKINIISSRNDLAYACLSDGETVKVKELAEITLGMAIETENKEELTRAYLTLGNCLVKMQKTKEARENFSQALKISKQINNKSLIGKTYYSIGELYIAEKEYLAAERPLKDSVMIFEELEENYELALSLISLYRLYEETGTESPTEYLTKGKEILHNLGVEIKNIKA